MNLFFEASYEYNLDEATEVVIEKIHTILNIKWYELGENLTGKIDKEGNFKLYKKAAFVTPFIFGWPAAASIKGSVTKKDEKTNIHITCTSSINTILLFYLAAFITICFGGKLLLTWEASQEEIGILLSLIIFTSCIFAIGSASVDFLISRFEKALYLKL